MWAFLPPLRDIRIQPDLTPGFDRIDDASEQNLRALQRATQETIARNEDVLDQSTCRSACAEAGLGHRLARLWPIIFASGSVRKLAIFRVPEYSELSIRVGIRS